MIDIELVKNKASDLQGYLIELQPLLKEESRAIIEDSLKLHTVERLFQLVVDTAVDINTHIISVSDYKVPDDYQNTFITLAENHVFSMDFALTIAPSVGLRNLVVHKYGKVDIKRMVDDIKAEIGQYKDYLRHINVFIGKQ